MAAVPSYGAPGSSASHSTGQASKGSSVAPPTSASGSGILHLSTPSNSHAPTTSRARFTTLIASYPLKLLSPTPLPSQHPLLAIIYTLAYGGGLVAADRITLRVTIEAHGRLLMLTQGSTKVFKRRAGIRPDFQSNPADPATKQFLHVTIASGGLLLLLPDSISPFRSATYVQSQRFILPSDGTGSLIVLDWVNSGRGGRLGESEGEEEIWSMESYTSTNEVWLGDEQIMRERMILDNTHVTHSNGKGGLPGVMTPVASRMAPYHVYATLLISGPLVAPLLNHLRTLCDATQQFQIHSPPDLTWSYSDVAGGNAGIVRCAGKRIEGVRDWIRTLLDRGGVKELVGEAIWPRAI